jgi:DNA-directed RNA polymerase sigma subunit (sigma70/sigma32)
MRKIKPETYKFIEIISTLSDREISILIYRFVMKKTIYEVGDIFSITGERVRQLEARAVLKITEGLHNLK